MSQNTVSFPDAPVCLPLLKFSYATVSNESVMPIPWIHLSSKTGLFAIFESTESTLDDGQIRVRKKFKVTNDPEIMVRWPKSPYSFSPVSRSLQEELDLDVLSIEAHRSMNTPPKSLVEAQLPNVTIIVQPPNIAIKYPLTNGQVLQISFILFLAHCIIDSSLPSPLFFQRELLRSHEELGASKCPDC